MTTLDMVSHQESPVNRMHILNFEAAYKCLEENYGAKQENIILYGQSVGSGPTVDLVARVPRLRAVCSV